MFENIRTIIKDGFKFSYLIEGHGFPLIIIGSPLYYPKFFSTLFKQHFQCIHIDHRGFAPSTIQNRPESDFHFDKIFDDILFIKKALMLEKTFIMGHSGHAFMALEFAKAYPDEVLGQILVGFTPDYSAKTHQIAHDFFEKKAESKRKELFAQNISQVTEKIKQEPDRRFVHFCLAAGPKSFYEYDYDATKDWENVTTNMKAIDYLWGVLFRDIDIKKNLNRIKSPTFLGIGKFDFLIGPEYLWDDYKCDFPLLTFKVYKKSAHYPFWEEPEEFDADLLHWLKTTTR